jgi:hypothetical protein
LTKHILPQFATNSTKQHASFNLRRLYVPCCHPLQLLRFLFPPNSLIFLVSLSLSSPARSLASSSLDACVPLVLDASGPLVGVKGRGDSNCGYLNIRQVSGNYPVIASSCELYNGENSVDPHTSSSPAGSRTDSIYRLISHPILALKLNTHQWKIPKIHTANYCLSEAPG